MALPIFVQALFINFYVRYGGLLKNSKYFMKMPIIWESHAVIVVNAKYFTMLRVFSDTFKYIEKYIFKN